MIQARIRLLFAAAMLILGPADGLAALLISNVELTPTSLSFDVRGTVDAVGTRAQQSFFIGEPFNDTWIVGGSPSSFGPITAGDWTYHSGSYRPYDTGAVYRFNGSPPGGYAYSNERTGRSIVVGDTVDMSFSVVQNNAFLNPANTDVSKWIVSAGYNVNASTLPDPSTKTGYAIPEPTTLALAAMLAGCCLLRYRANRPCHRGGGGLGTGVAGGVL